MAGHAGLPEHPARREVGIRRRAYAYLLGIVAIFAGVATMVLGSSRLVDMFGGAVVLGGLGAAAWATSFLKQYVAALLITALISGVIVLVMLMSRP